MLGFKEHACLEKELCNTCVVQYLLAMVRTRCNREVNLFRIIHFCVVKEVLLLSELLTGGTFRWNAK